MGLLARLREATRGKPGTVSSPGATAEVASSDPVESRTSATIARPPHAAKADRPDPQADGDAAAAEATRVRARRVEVQSLAVVDLAPLESVRTRIKGSAYCVTDSERRRYGGTEYLLIREPDNEVDASAVAVYGKGRRVGFLSAARAAALAPLLDELSANAFRVTGAGASHESLRLWVDVPKVDALRKYVRAHR